MTQAQFNKDFEEVELIHIKNTFESDGIKDNPARMEAYNNKLDFYHKEGLITDKQVNNWVIPNKYV